MSDLETAVVALDDLELDRLAAGGPAGDDPVLALLAALRDDVSRDLPDAAPHDGVVVPLQRRRHGAHGPRHLSRSAVAAAAAIAVVSAGGVAAAGVAAAPGSPLYPVREALVGSTHPSDSDVSAVQHLLSGAASALRDGRLGAARSRLVEAERRLDHLDPSVAAGERSRLAVLKHQLDTSGAPASATRSTPAAAGPAATAAASPSAAPSADGSATPAGTAPTTQPSGDPSASAGSDPSAQPTSSASGSTDGTSPSPAPSRNPWQGRGDPPTPAPAPVPLPTAGDGASAPASPAPSADPATSPSASPGSSAASSG